MGLVEYLPSWGSGFHPEHHAYLKSQHSRSGGKIGSSRLSWLHSKFKVSLGKWDAVSKQNNIPFRTKHYTITYSQLDHPSQDGETTSKRRKEHKSQRMRRCKANRRLLDLAWPPHSRPTAAVVYLHKACRAHQHPSWVWEGSEGVLFSVLKSLISGPFSPCSSK